MATRQQIPFRGLNTDLPAELLRTGTAAVATNVVIENGILKKRAGFNEWEDDITAGGDSCLNITVAKFANGNTYVVCKMADGFLWQREVGQSDFTKITDLWSGHTTTEAGSFYQWADRLYYFDSNGGTKWHPTAGTWKAGIGQGTKPTASATTGGAKDLRYHYYTTFKNSVTGEEGLYSNPSVSVTCALDGNNAIAIASITMTTDYEADTIVGYTTKGDTEYLAKGDGVEIWSFRAYRDKHRSGSGSLKSTAADSTLELSNRISTQWGLPPAAPIVAFNGERAIYTGATDGIINFSVNRFPCAVPNLVVWTSSDNQFIGDAEPWESWIGTGMIGAVTEMCFGGGTFGVYTDSDIWVMIEDRANGRLRPRHRLKGKGCVVHQASTQAEDGIHAIGYRCWTILNSNGVRDLAYNRFEATLGTIPVASQTKTRMATFSYKDQVWAAVVPAGESYAQNILVWDRREGGVDDEGRIQGALSIFEIAGMAADEDITCMTELQYATAEPSMLIATDDGRILQYPSLVGDDNAAGTRVHYAAEWRGYIGTERVRYKQILEKIYVHAGPNVENYVTLTYRDYRTSDETRDKPTELVIDRSNRIVTYGPADFEQANARFYQVGFVSTNRHTARWEITALTADLGGHDPR